MTASPLGIAQNNDWPNPRLARWRSYDFIAAQPFPLRGKDRFPPGVIGGRDFDWPNPRTWRLGNSRQWQYHIQPVALNLLGKDRFPPGLVGAGPDFDWPNPLRRPQNPPFSSFGSLALGAITQPFSLADWPNPTLSRRPQHEAGLPASIFDLEMPVGLSDWPNPARQRLFQHEAGLPSALLYAPITVTAPVQQVDWPNPAFTYRVTMEAGQPSLLGLLTPPPPPIIIDLGDTHDGDRQRAGFNKLRTAREDRRKALVRAYEAASGETPMLANQIVAPFVDEDMDPGKAYPIAAVDFNKLLRDTERVRRLLDAAIEADDEEAMLLL
jgi:hypothetical protein